MTRTDSVSVSRDGADRASFEQDAERVLHDVQDTLATVVEHLRPPITRATQLRRLLKLGQKVSWGLFTAATTRDPRTLPSLLPKRRGMETFLSAAAERGVPQDVIQRARSAFDRFEDSVTRHAGSRDVYETMAAELDADRLGTHGQEAASADLRHKRAAFRANSLLWGRQARLATVVRICHPSETPGLLDLVSIRGLEGLRRTRRTSRLHLTVHHWHVTMPGDPDKPGSREPLDPRESGPEDMWLIRDFCSQPLPQFRLCESNDGYRKYELLSDAVGAAGEVTCYIGEARRAESVLPGSAPGAESAISIAVGTPSEICNVDMLMHKDICGTAPPEVAVYAWPLDGSPEYRDSDLMPQKESAEYLGTGIETARNPTMPRHADLLKYATDRMGWNPDDFRVFRCRVRYPILYSRIRMTFR